MGIVESRTFISELINTRPASGERDPTKAMPPAPKTTSKERRREIFFTRYKAYFCEGKYKIIETKKTYQYFFLGILADETHCILSRGFLESYMHEKQNRKYYL